MFENKFSYITSKYVITEKLLVKSALFKRIEEIDLDLYLSIQTVLHEYMMVSPVEVHNFLNVIVKRSYIDTEEFEGVITRIVNGFNEIKDERERDKYIVKMFGAYNFGKGLHLIEKFNEIKELATELEKY